MVLHETRVTGMDETLAKMRAKFSPGRLSRYENAALNKAAEYVEEELKKSVGTYSYVNSRTGATGETKIEVAAGKARMRGSVRSVNIGWAGGAMERWRLVHLNEFGYTRWHKTYSPKGMGKIQATYDAIKQPAMDIQREELKKLL